MKRAFVVLALAFVGLSPQNAQAKCDDLSPAGTICGNPSGSTMAAGNWNFHKPVMINTTGRSDPSPGARANGLAIWSDPSTTLTGQNAALQVWVTGVLTGTPGANDAVAATFVIDNLNGRKGIWPLNIVQVQQPQSAGGGYGIAHGIEVNNVASIPLADPTSAFAPGPTVHAMELVGNSGSAVSPQVANWVWAAEDKNVIWWNFGNACARVNFACLVAENISGDKTPNFTKGFIWDRSSSAAVIKDSGTHASFIDLTDNPRMTQFVKGAAAADTNLVFANGANHGVSIDIDSGASSAQLAGLVFSDRRNGKWAFFKDGGNNLNLQNIARVTTPISINVATDATKFSGAVSAPNLTLSTTVKTGVTTVSGLPKCDGDAEGTRYGVTDASATAFLSKVAGGGANHVPVYCNGTNWVISG